MLIPKKLFSTPPGLLDFLCEKKVTNLTWAVSALTLVSSLKGLDYRVPETVKRVLFSGEAYAAEAAENVAESPARHPVCESVRAYRDYL